MAEKEPKLEPGDAAELAKGFGALTAEEVEKLRNHLCPDEGDSAVGETLEDILRYWIEHESHPTRALLEEKLQGLAKDKPVGEEEKPSFFKRFVTAVSESGKRFMRNADIKDLINACGEGKDLGKVNNLLKIVKPNVVHNTQTPLLAASLMGHLEFVKVLVLAKADVNFVAEGRAGRPALNAACSRGHVEVAEYLLDQDASVNATDGESWTALHEAAFNTHKEVVSLLIERGANLEKKSDDGSTALMLASSGGDVETVELLLKSRAKTSHRIRKFGRTAIHIAASRGHHQVVQLLLKATDSSIDDQDSNGATPLVMTIRAHRRRPTPEAQEKANEDLLKTVKFLIEAKANLNTLTKEGKTALIYAVELNLSDEAKVLVDAGADLDIQDKKNGWSAIFYAVEKAEETMFSVLRDAGANLTLQDMKKRSLLNVAQQYSPTILAILDTIGAVIFTDQSTEREEATAIEESQESEAARKNMPSYYTFDDDKYPGVRFFGRSLWKQEVTSTGGHVDWMEEIGVEFDIPPGAVPEDKTLKLSVRPCSKGPFEFPGDFRLASPVYLISPSFEFSKEVTLTLSHYSNLDEGHRAVFLSAPTSPKMTETSQKPVYQFKVLGEGTFNVDCGQISLTHFCLVSVGHQGTRNKYVYTVYRDIELENMAIFSAFLDQKAFCLALKESVKEFGRRLKSLSSKSISLVGDKIELKWLGDTVRSDEHPCQLTQEQLDATEWIPYPPMIKLEIASNVEPTTIEIEILGTKEAIKFFLYPKQGRSSRSLSLTTSSTVNPISPTQSSAGEDNVFLNPPSPGSHQETSSEPPELTLIRTNLTFIKSTVVNSASPSWFADHLIEKEFIARSVARGIIKTSGITPEEKASELLDSVFSKIENEMSSIERRRWFKKFVAIFSDDPVYADLVSKLKLDTTIKPAETGSNSPTPAPSPPPHLSASTTETVSEPTDPYVPATDSSRDTQESSCTVA